MKRPEQYFDDSIESLPISLFQADQALESQFHLLGLQNKISLMQQAGPLSLGARSEFINDVFLSNGVSVFKVQPIKMSDIIEYCYL